jgi:uncharacterized protein YuzE
MRISYDPKFNIAYIKFRTKRASVDTMPLSDEVNIDIAADGKVYGIELLNANAQLSSARQKQFLFLNESTGKELNIPLTPA